MKLVPWNIQWGRGAEGRVDLVALRDEQRLGGVVEGVGPLQVGGEQPP